MRALAGNGKKLAFMFTRFFYDPPPPSTPPPPGCIAACAIPTGNYEGKHKQTIAQRHAKEAMTQASVPLPLRRHRCGQVCRCGPVGWGSDASRCRGEPGRAGQGRCHSGATQLHGLVRGTCWVIAGVESQRRRPGGAGRRSAPLGQRPPPARLYECLYRPCPPVAPPRGQGAN